MNIELATLIVSAVVAVTGALTTWSGARQARKIGDDLSGQIGAIRERIVRLETTIALSGLVTKFGDANMGLNSRPL